MCDLVNLKIGNSSRDAYCIPKKRVYNPSTYTQIVCQILIHEGRAPMNYSIQLVEEPRFVQAITSGEWERDVDNAMGLEIMKKMAEWQVNKALIDMRELQFDLRVLEIFQRAEALRDQRREVKSPSTKVALVYLPKDQKVDEDFIFFENTARNRGLPYRVFKQMEKALAWLSE